MHARFDTSRKISSILVPGLTSSFTGGYTTSVGLGTFVGFGVFVGCGGCVTTWIVGLAVVGIAILVGRGPFVGRIAGVDVGISVGPDGSVSQSRGVGSTGCSLGIAGWDAGGTNDTSVGNLNDCSALMMDVSEFESDCDTSAVIV